MSETTPKVYQAINRVQAALAKEGITKSRKNEQQGYKFRGIDEIYNSLSSLLAENHICILPRIIEHNQVERQSQRGGALFYSFVKCEFDIVSSEDGSKHTVQTYGEAMDSADKSLNKSMSAAYKYMALMTFAIPTEGDNDADATTHEVAPTQRQAPTKAPPKKSTETPKPSPKPADNPKPAKIPEVTDSASAYEFIKQALYQWWQCQSRDEANAVAKFICGHTYEALSKDGNLCRDNYQKFQAAHDANDTELKSKALAASTPV